MADECLFCRIVRHDIPAHIVAETPECVAFRDINPQAPTHVLVVPREHIPTPAEAKDPAVIGRMSALAARLAREEGIERSGYRMVMNTGADAGQTVSHIHLHLLGGRRLGWPPG